MASHITLGGDLEWPVWAHADAYSAENADDLWFGTRSKFSSQSCEERPLLIDNIRVPAQIAVS